MRAWELILETYRRRHLIPIVHIVIFIAYAFMFAIWYFDREMQPGFTIFTVSGFLLPVVLTAGILGADIRSGRFRVLATEPLPLASLYAWRLVGVVIQGIIHLVLLTGAILVLDAMIGGMDLRHLFVSIGCAFMMFVSTAALSTTFSVHAKGEQNVLAILALIPLIIATLSLREFFVNPFWNRACDIALLLEKYGLPPAILFGDLLDEGGTWNEILGCAMHSAALTLIYAVIGIALLNFREFKPQRSA